MGVLERLTVGGKPERDTTTTWVYEAVAGNGERRTDRVKATSSDAVASQLRAAGLFPVSIRPEASGLSMDIGQAMADRPLSLDAGELAEFSRQLYQMMVAGINAPAAILALGEDSDNAKMKEVTQQISSRISAGVPLSDAFGEHPKAFDEVFCAYIAAGEASGTLDVTLGRLATMLEKRSNLVNKIKGVTAYPKMVGGAIAAIVTGIILFLVPMYADIYEEFGADLPAPTQALVTVSRFFPIIAVLTVVGIVSLRRWLARDHEPDTLIAIDRVRYRLPVFGRLYHKTALFQWTSTLGGGMRSGVQTYDALELAARASGSGWMRAIVGDLTRAVREGRPISSELKQHPELFPANVRTMIGTGEETGDIPEMLGSVSDSLDSDIDRIVATLSSKIEVALLLVLGVVVGGMLAVLYLPILNLADTAMQGMT